MTRIEDLIIKSVYGKSTPEEKAELKQWIDADPKHKVFIETRMTPEAIQAGIIKLWDKEGIRIKQELAREMESIRHNRLLKKRLSKNRKAGHCRTITGPGK